MGDSSSPWLDGKACNVLLHLPARSHAASALPDDPIAEMSALMESTLPSQESCSIGPVVEVADVSAVLYRRGPAIGMLEEAVDAADHALVSLHSGRIHGCLEEMAFMDAMLPPGPHLLRRRTGRPSALRRQ